MGIMRVKWETNKRLSFFLSSQLVCQLSVYLCAITERSPRIKSYFPCIGKLARTISVKVGWVQTAVVIDCTDDDPSSHSFLCYKRVWSVKGWFVFFFSLYLDSIGLFGLPIS